MSKEQKRFEEWWDAKDDIPNNGPWTHNTPIQFAWAGWQAALPQPEQEPVAWGVFDHNLHDMFFTEEEAQEMVRLKGDGSTVKPLYTTPPAAAQRPWVSLTPKEVKEISFANRPYVVDMVVALEAKLKEKNT